MTKSKRFFVFCCKIFRKAFANTLFSTSRNLRLKIWTVLETFCMDISAAGTFWILSCNGKTVQLCQRDHNNILNKQVKTIALTAFVLYCELRTRCAQHLVQKSSIFLYKFEQVISSWAEIALVSNSGNCEMWNWYYFLSQIFLAPSFIEL